MTRSLKESPTRGGVECACLLAFAYSDHNRSLIVFANELDNYELVKLLILNTRVHWNYRVIRSLLFLLLITMASQSTASPKKSTVDATPQTFRGSGGRFSKASPGNKNAKSQAMQDPAAKSWEEIDALFCKVRKNNCEVGYKGRRSIEGNGCLQSSK